MVLLCNTTLGTGRKERDRGHARSEHSRWSTLIACPASHSSMSNSQSHIVRFLFWLRLTKKSSTLDSLILAQCRERASGMAALVPRGSIRGYIGQMLTPKLMHYMTPLAVKARPAPATIAASGAGPRANLVVHVHEYRRRWMGGWPPQSPNRQSTAHIMGKIWVRLPPPESSLFIHISFPFPYFCISIKHY